MRTFITAFTLPKNGQTPEQNQDSLPRLFRAKSATGEFVSREINNYDVRISISDGASEGLLSELWARILVSQSRLHFPGEWKLHEFVNKCEVIWRRYIRRRKSRGEPLTKLPDWIEEPALQRGAFATLLTLHLRADKTYDAVAVGDSCLFHFHGKDLSSCWPLSDETAFSASPFLISSEAHANEGLEAKALLTTGSWQDEDTFVLATDALSAWFLRCLREGKDIHRLIQSFDAEPKLRDESMEDEQSFCDFVDSARKRGMRNDDVTLVRIDIT